MTRSARARVVGALVVLLVLAALGGCATVPGSSEVTVLRRLGEPAEPSDPPGPVRGAAPLDIARGWVVASGATAERHEAARAFLTPQAAGTWDDGAEPTVVGDQVDTVFGGPAAPGQAVVRVRATRLGVVTPEGAFLSRPGVVDLPVALAQSNGQWRIASLPSGVLVRRSDLRANTRQVRVWFVDPLRGAPVADIRYVATSPARSVAARTLQLLLAGPSSSLAGAAVSALPPGAALRAAVAQAADGTTVVDLAPLGALDEPRRTQIAQQIGLTLAGVGVPRVRLLVDGVPLLAGRPDVGAEELVAGLPRLVAERRDLPVSLGTDGAAQAATPGVIVAGGQVRSINGAAQAGPAGAGEYGARAAGVSVDGQFVAVVAPTAPAPGGPAPGPVPPGQRLLAGTVGSELSATGIEGATIAAPTWPAETGEVWTVVDGVRVVRSVLDPRTRAFRPVEVDAAGLTALGPVTALRFSPDGVRVAAVVGGRVAVGAVARDATGGARVSSVQVLRPDAVTDVLDVGWLRTDRLVAVGARTDRPVALLTVDGLVLDNGPTTNLTPPVTAVAAAPGRPLVAVDQSGTWALPGTGADVGSPGEVWRALAAGAGAVPAYPG